MNQQDDRESVAREEAARLDARGAQGDEGLVAGLRERCAALEEENRDLRAAVRGGASMFAQLSYEMRSPLTSILGYAELLLLEDEDLSERQRGYCERIEGAGNFLHGMVRHIADLSRLEFGTREPPVAEVSLGALLSGACAVVEPLARKRGVALDCSVVPEMDKLVSDEGALRQIFGNLILQAVARSPSGGTVRVLALPITGGRAVEIEEESETPEFPTPWRAGDHAWGFSCHGVSELEMTISRRIVKGLGGALLMKRGASGGLVVRVELPALAPRS